MKPDLESRLWAQIAHQRGPAGERWSPQVRLCGWRDYRLDFAVPELRLYIEVQGGTWARKRKGHATGHGIARDAQKAALAAVLGWRGFPVTADMIQDSRASLLAEALLLTGGSLPDSRVWQEGLELARRAGRIGRERARTTERRRRAVKRLGKSQAPSTGSSAGRAIRQRVVG